ncbi:MAG: flavin reductase family protein [Synergistaceae bacterium]|nr:flavin reductase family protein [Synergistaceae bacterium]
MLKDLGCSLPAVYPMPVLMVATYGEDGKVDVMTVAWGSICGMDKIALYLAKDRKTLKNINARKAFTVSLADEAHLKEIDFLGTASGNTTPDKFERTGLHAVKSKNVDAPVVEEFPVTMECKLEEVRDCFGEMQVVGTIVNVLAEEKTLDEAGKVNAEKINAVIFDQFRNTYYTSGKEVAKAWRVGAELMKK